MKRLNQFLVFIFLITRLYSQPTAFHISEGIRPNSIFSIYGHDLDRDMRIRLVETGDVLMPVQKDDHGRFIRAIMPDGRNGAYTLELSNDGGNSWYNSNPYHTLYNNKADVRWTGDYRVYEGLKARLVGRNLDAVEFNGISNTEVQLVASMVDSLTAHNIVYTVPPGIVGDEYYVEVRTSRMEKGIYIIQIKNYITQLSHKLIIE